MRLNEVNGQNIQNDVIREKLLEIICDYKIKLDTLNKVTGIEIEWLSEYIDKKKSISDLQMDEYGYLFDVVIVLSEGMKGVSDDARIKGVIEVLIRIFGLGYDTLSIYTGLEKEEIELFMRDPALVDYEKKYRLATKIMFLHYMFKNKNNTTMSHGS